MNLTVRSASAEVREDRQQMLALLSRNLPQHRADHFQWRHFDNPAGEAWSAFLCDGPNGAAVAMASVFPRHMFVDGARVTWGQVAEFVVDAKYRSLGPAVMLQRATFRPVDLGFISVCFDCPPHDQGMSTFNRLGMQANTEVFRYALALRSDQFLAIKLGNGALAKPVVAAANLALKLKRSARGKSTMHGVEISVLEGNFGEEFTKLDQSVSSLGIIRGSRSAEVLNWRHKQQPGCKFYTLVARRFGELLGFLTAIDFSGRIAIWDIFGHQLEGLNTTLIDALIEHSVRKKSLLVEGYSSFRNSLTKDFLEAGFVRRERLARVVAYEKPTHGVEKTVRPDMQWAFTLTEPGPS
jgi:hypothetical protein